MEKKTVVFLEDRTVENPGGKPDIFLKGKAYELPLTSCERWIRRGVAHYKGDEPVVDPTVAEKEAADAAAAAEKEAAEKEAAEKAAAEQLAADKAAAEKKKGN